jgi:xylulokinase
LVKTFLLGADVGTSGCKVILFDIKGNIINKSFQTWNVSIPRAAWAEQNPDVWWAKLCIGIRKVTEGVDTKKIAGIAVSGLGPSVTAIDKNGKVLRPAIIWMDQRATEEATFLSSLTGRRIGASSTNAKVLWIKKNEPKIYEKTYKFLQSYDYIDFKLTGGIKTPIKNSSIRKFYEEQLDIMDFPREKFADPVFIGAIHGEITQKAAKETSLTKGTTVVAATYDAYSSIIGSGVIKSGYAADVGGTSQVFSLCWNKKVESAPNRGIECSSHMIPGLWIVSGAMSTTGASLKWFRDTVALTEINKAKRMNVTAFEILSQEAEKADPGSNNLVFLPYMMGERSPINDPYARGIFFGLSFNHKREHLIRAVMEGVAYGIRHIMENIESLGPKVKEVRATGGQAKSRTWMQIKADVLNKPVTKSAITDTEPLGSAILAGIGVGVFKNVTEAVESMIHVTGRIEPRPDYYDRYNKLFEIYKEVYLNSKETFKKLTN